MASLIHVEIPKSIGSRRVDLGGLSWTEVAARAAGLGGTVGSVIPGVGTAIGGAVGGAVGSVASWLGFGSGRDELRDVMRKLLREVLGSIFPGELTFHGSARDIPRLPDQYRTADVRQLLDEIGRVILAELEPGSEAYAGVALAFQNMAFHERDSADHYAVLQFEASSAATPAIYETPEPDEPTVLIPETNVETDGRSNRQPVSVTTFSPTVLGVGAAILVILLAR